MNKEEEFRQLMIVLRIGRGLKPEDKVFCKNRLAELSQELSGKKILNESDIANRYLLMEEPEKAWVKSDLCVLRLIYIII